MKPAAKPTGRRKARECWVWWHSEQRKRPRACWHVPACAIEAFHPAACPSLGRWLLMREVKPTRRERGAR